MQKKAKKAVWLSFLRCRDGAGFSLLEVIIVVGIFSVVASIGALSVRGWLPNIRLRAAARDLYGNMQSARLMALKNNTPIGLVYDGANERYAICTSPGADDDWATFSDNDKTLTIDVAPGYGSKTIARVTAAADQFLGNATTLVVFLPDGSSVGSGFLYLQNTNPNSNGSIYAVGARVANGKVILRKQ
jgi:prepilin-type N-terminal cleavage/methylation domain-containing protein